MSSKLISLGLQQPEKRSKLAYVPFGGSDSWQVFGSGRIGDSGEFVNEHTALSIATVFACVRILSESVAALSIKLYRRTDQGRIEALGSSLHYLLSVSPNPEMSAFVFIETLVKGLVLTGNCYAEVERDDAGGVYGLWPLDPQQTYPMRRDDGSLVYRTTDGEAPGQARDIPAQNVLHCPLFPGYDGLIGLSPLQVSMQAFGQAIAADRFSARFFRNFATPAIAIEVADEVDPKMKALMREDWEGLQSGSNAHRVAILDQGMKLQKLSLSPDECQFIETKKLLREDIAGIYRVPLFMLGSSERLSQASAEQISLSFVTDTLRPLTDRLCAEITRKLLQPKRGQPMEFVVEADMTQRLRGDTAAATTYYKTMVQTGIMSPNEARRAQNLNVGPASLDVYQVPVNMQNSERLLDPRPTAQATPESISVE